MKRVSLPNGWADLREAADVTERQRRPIKRIQAQLAAKPAFSAAVAAAQRAGNKDLSIEDQQHIAAGMGDAFDLLEELNDLLVVAVVAGWSYGDSVTVDAVQDLPGRDLDALRTAVSPYLRELFPDFDPKPDADSPTVPSVD